MAVRVSRTRSPISGTSLSQRLYTIGDTIQGYISLSISLGAEAGLYDGLIRKYMLIHIWGQA